MKINFCTVPPSHGLDAINVIFIDHAPNKGEIILTCYGQAWIAHFNAMPYETALEFFMKAPHGYMEDKFSQQQFKLLKSEHTRMEAYLHRIVRAVRIFHDLQTPNEQKEAE